MTNVALRYRAVFLDLNREDINMHSEITVPVAAFIQLLNENGFCANEELLHALNSVSPYRLAVIAECINEVFGLDLNWAPLVKEWNVPTGETAADHLITFIVNQFFTTKTGFKGTTLPCGHFIPEGTFPLERYNGCPFCGTPFKTLVAHARKLYFHLWGPLDRSMDAAKEMKNKLMLKYDRKTCRCAARWMNAIPLTAKQAAENMRGCVKSDSPSFLQKSPNFGGLGLCRVKDFCILCGITKRDGKNTI